MIPNIFISSTVSDLQYLRDALRDTISELGYNPIMSDYGEIGYLPSISVEDACYKRVLECQILILIIGKKYSTLTENGFSVTHNEYITAKENNIPVICLIDKEVMTIKKVFDSRSSISRFKEMDNPKMTFSLINEFISSKVNNGFSIFNNVQDARNHLKRQLAFNYGSLLADRYGTIKSDISSIISEIKTLKQQISSNKPDQIPNDFQIGTKVLINYNNRFIYRLLSKLKDNIEDTVIPFLNNDKLIDFLREMNYSIQTPKINDFVLDDTYKGKGYCYRGMYHHLPENIKGNPGEKLSYCIDKTNKVLYFNDLTNRYFIWKYQDLKEQLKDEKNN